MLSEENRARPSSCEQLNEMALTHARALFRERRFDAAESRIREVLSQTMDNAALLLLLGQILREQGKTQEALRTLDRAAALGSDAIETAVHRGLLQLDLRDAASAVQTFQDVAQQAPDVGEYHRLLGIARRRARDFDGARRAFEVAARLAPGDPAVIVDLAAILEELNRPDAAFSTLQSALATIGAHRLLVEATVRALRRRGRHHDAAAWITRLLTDNPEVAWLHGQMAMTLESFDRARANTYFEQARALDRADTRLLVAHADSLNRTRGPQEAENITKAYQLALDRLERPVGFRPDTRVLYGIFVRNADFGAVARLGRFEEIGDHYAATGQYSALHLLLAQAETSRHRQLLIDWHKACGDLIVETARRTPLSQPASPPVVGRAKIRVGLMSSDLRDHPIGHFVHPLVRHYDRERFEFYAYSWSTREADGMQTALTGLFDQFRHKAPISNRDAAQLIANDHLDVLFDLGGSTDMNKLEALAWRPAPRIASWLGYPHSAGLETIDRILVDPFLEPSNPDLLIERPFRLARSWVAVEWIGANSDHAIAPRTPGRRTGRLTFGTMNNPYKYNPELIATWAEILHETPGSRFLFVRPEGGVDSFRENIRARFDSHGIAPDRIFFSPVRGRHMPHYNDIDVALDTFPQTGGTTTCETLWMGVPVVSLVGEAFFERLSYSNLSNAGLADLAVFDRAAYVEKAVAIARDEEWREELRRTIRARFAAQPLGDGPGFARDFEKAILAWKEERNS